MAEKSSSAAAEGPSIFESLFGGFSNGLSIFTNNPFRRKSEAALSADEDTSGENDDEFDGSKIGASNEGISGQDEDEGIGQKVKNVAMETTAEKTGDSLDQEGNGDGDDQQNSTVPVERSPESILKKINKRADEEVVSSEKKRRKTESVREIVDDEILRSGSSDSRKRKPEPMASGMHADGGAGQDEAKKNNKKKSTESEQQVLRQSTRSISKKRLNEDLLFSQGMGSKERKLEKTFATSEEKSANLGEKVVKPTAKRGPEESDEGDEKHKKKTKRLEEIVSEERPVPGKGTEEQGAAGPPPAAARETRLGSKRKKDSNVEELYERKRREIVDGKGNAKVHEGNTEQAGIAPSELADRLRNKRKSVSEDDGEDAAIGAKKKKKKTKEERLDNEERLKRTIFVGNLPVGVKPKQLLREFSRFGAVESARLRSVPLVDTKMPRKAAVITGQLNESRSSLNGYVVFQTEDSARAALAHNMTEFKGKHIRVDMATPPRKGDKIGDSGIEYDRSRSIFVGNLPFDVEDEEVYSVFQGKTPDLEVEAVRVVRDPQTSIGKGFAFVCFKNKIGATTALDNAEFTRLRNRQLRIIRFGFQKKQTGGNLSAKPSSGNYKSKPRPGAEERISKRSVLSYEGTRASKVDGRPGKATAPTASQKGKSNERAKSSKSGKAGKSSVAPKRPAVAARKLASQGNAGTLVPAEGKRKREEKGVLCLPPPAPVSASAQLTEKLWSVVRSVGSYASSSFKDLLQESSEVNSSSMGGSMRKLLFNIDKRPETGSGATSSRELALVPVPSTRGTRRQ